MASPQLENGYLRIANEIAQQLVKTPLLGAEFQIILFIITKTYGFNKKKDWISLTQFEKGTGLSRPTVVKALKNLIIKNLLIKSEKFEFTFNKDWERWVVKTPLLVKYKDTTSKDTLTKSGKDTLTHKRHNTITKDNSTFSKEKDAITNNKKKTMKNNKLGKYNESNNSDSYEEVIDYDTQEQKKEPEPKRHKAIRYIQDYFSAKCIKATDEKPAYGIADYTHIANLYTKGYKPSELKEIIDWYFDTETNQLNLIQIKTCLSNFRINNHKIYKKLK